ncbi:MAG: hypothetical protein MUE97_04105 [Phycisphaerales bacterium]|jgi:hypothetical protein|nr:hypothetical protein [Phycisphaerales bacterium]
MQLQMRIVATVLAGVVADCCGVSAWEGAASARQPWGPNGLGVSVLEESKPKLPAGVLATLVQMREAIIARDKEAYMRLVVPGDGPMGDPIFRTEQSRWCDDWVKTPVGAISIEGTAANPPVGAGATARDDGLERVYADLKWIWRYPASEQQRTRPLGTQSLVRPKSVQFVGLFVRPRGGDDAAWRYGGEVWVTVEKPPAPQIGFAGGRVKFEPKFGADNEDAQGDEAVLAKVASIAGAALPEVRREVDAFFGVKLTCVQEIKFYRSMKHLQHSIWLSYADPLGGWNEPGESIKLMATGARPQRIKQLLAHEYAHVVTFTLGPKATDAPWWMLEGVAELASAPYRPEAKPRRDRQVGAWARQDNLAEWEHLAAFPLKPEHAKYMTHVYVQGEHMMAWLTTRFGEAARTKFVRALCNGASLDEASRAVFDSPWLALDVAWRQDVMLLGRDGAMPMDDVDEP